MSNANIIPFKLDHLECMELREYERLQLEFDPSAASKMAALATYGLGGTIIWDGRILGVIGYLEMWPGVYEVWAFPSVWVERYATVYLRTVKQYIKVIEAEHPIHRLQSAAISDELHDKWMSFLGFTEEGVLRQYGYDKKDFKQWARII